MKNKLLIKLGGRAFETTAHFSELAAALKKMKQYEVIIVHGGGADITRALQNARRQAVFIDGLRMTTKEDMHIVETVLSRQVNTRIVTHLTEHGIACQQLSGRSQGLFMVKPLIRNGKNLGYVGEIERVNSAVVLNAIERGLTPVISPVSADESGISYNVNADTAAAALAIDLNCQDLIYFTDVPGISVENKHIASLSVDKAREYIASGAIHGGMVAKLESVFSALAAGVGRVHICQWQGENTLTGILGQQPKNGTTIHL